MARTLTRFGPLEPQQSHFRCNCPRLAASPGRRERLVLLAGLRRSIVDALVVALGQAVDDGHQEVEHHGQDELLEDPADDARVLKRRFLFELMLE